MIAVEVIDKNTIEKSLFEVRSCFYYDVENCPYFKLDSSFVKLLFNLE